MSHKTMRDPFDVKRAAQKAQTVAPNIPTNIVGSLLPSTLNFNTYDTERVVRNAYRKNSLVASIIGFYLRMFAQAKFKVVNTDDPKKKGNPAFARLMSHPNPEQTESRFRINFLLQLLNFGSCFVLIGRNGKYGGQPTQLWC